MRNIKSLINNKIKLIIASSLLVFIPLKSIFAFDKIEGESLIVTEKSESILVVDDSSFEYRFKRSDTVYNLLNTAAELSVAQGDDGSSEIFERVQICVTGHWPFNGCYNIGSATLECADLLGEGESFPSGVSCSNL